MLFAAIISPTLTPSPALTVIELIVPALAALMLVSIFMASKTIKRVTFGYNVAHGGDCFNDRFPLEALLHQMRQRSVQGAVLTAGLGFCVEPCAL